jgi:hypothetical protein
LGYRFEESQLWGNSFGQQLWGTILGSNFGDHVQSLERISLLMGCDNPRCFEIPIDPNQKWKLMENPIIKSPINPL